MARSHARPIPAAAVSRSFSTFCLVVTAALLAFGIAAEAAPQRYVASTGSDANNCNFNNPCRTLQRAVEVSPDGGMVIVLDSASYGNSLTITKSVTIVADGVTATLSNRGNIAINAAGAVVSLRGLTLKGQGAIGNGINIVAAAAVHIERCVVHGFGGDGIVATAGVALFVLDSVSRDNGSAGLVVSAGPSSRLTVDNSRFENNNNGVIVDAGRATLHRSTVFGNSGMGIFAASGSLVSVVSTTATGSGQIGFYVTAGTVMTVESSVAHGNVNGLVVDPGGLARLSNSAFTHNTTGISNSGVVETRGTNTVRGNTTNLSGNTLTPIPGI